jgi:anion-transporting  ArsA/GET3 family ATPase
MSDENLSNLESWIKSSRILVTVGSGGVGKTTTSIALALLGAKLGMRVGLLSIDPAKRLADALGISLSSELSRVKLDRSIPGYVEAAMLDQKAVFDDMVRRFAPSPSVATKIFNNSIYKEVSSNLGGPLEYMALAKLESMVSQGHYDLIVLDTPPDTHALDFLARPNILAGFIENGVMSWMIKPFHLAQKLGAGAIFKAGGKVMHGLSSITGIKMLKLLAEFLVLMEEVIIGFNRVGRQVSIALKQPTTGFVLVSAPSNNAVRSASYLLQELKNNQYPLLTIIMNRNMPFALQEAVQAWNQAEQQWTELEPGLNVISRRHQYAASQAGKLGQQARALFGPKLPLLLLEEQRQMIHSEASLWQFTEALLKAKHQEAT